ncbi:MAG: hypothetical protein A2754_02855 [Candidatus Magasanikbacteria bacterium RIFCSPHIGHO2_01_FULL_47_8]|uniref:tRNA-dihydrouridine synthase n=1 Tax=Candidatus Magasanikbacteria bacterium RIFCSPHIGHO2_01_FULL_47_8 TaxID=1798673 RepID=A0A1F6ME37_9BACT|nr:MAG: hypothetical protein A2754_02855 [Candidatus Magasanikbacteria bacterium RIFCSPHIGHO2_01_FULL_47_8]
MVTGFWKNLPKPIYCLAPMANVTDAAFRFIIAKYSKYGGMDIGDGSKANLPAEAFRVGGPDIMWTEFVSCDGLCSPGKDALMVDLAYTESERPIVTQIFGSKPDNFYKTALLCQELGFDGIDINMGCPDKNVEKQCAGAAMIKNPKLAQECIRATQKGAGNLPISVKTRTGYSKNQLDEWLPYLLETNLSAITIHARTRKEMSLVPAHWENIAQAVKLRDNFDSSPAKTLILGNGDVKDLTDAEEKIRQTGADGIMIGRGIFGNPWLFARHSPSTEEKLKVMVEHTYLFEKLLGKEKSFDIMKKHYKAYVNGFDGAKELRVKLMATKTANEVENLVNEHLLVPT